MRDNLHTVTVPGDDGNKPIANNRKNYKFTLSADTKIFARQIVIRHAQRTLSRNVKMLARFFLTLNIQTSKAPVDD